MLASSSETDPSGSCRPCPFVQHMAALPGRVWLWRTKQVARRNSAPTDSRAGTASSHGSFGMHVHRKLYEELVKHKQQEEHSFRDDFEEYTVAHNHDGNAHHNNDEVVYISDYD